MTTRYREIRMKSFITQFVVALALLVGMQARAQEIPIFRDEWVPDANKAVAVWNGKAITERDVYLWMLMTWQDPLKLKDWEVAVKTNDRTSLDEVELGIRRYVEGHLLAESPEALKGLTEDLRWKGGRIYSSPVARLVYATEIIPAKVEINDVDIAYYYRSHRDDFVEPESVEVRRLRISLPQQAGPDSEREAMHLAETLRSEALQNDGLASVLDRSGEYLIEPRPEDTKTIRRGHSDADPLLEAEAFRLALHEISGPIKTDTAVFLLELVSRTPGKSVPLEEVRDQIIKELRPTHLFQQYGYHGVEAVRKSRGVNRVSQYLFLDDDVDIFTVRSFGLTKGEFKKLFPDVSNTSPDALKVPDRLVIFVSNYFLGEIVSQELEKAGLTSHPVWQRGRELGDIIVRGANAAWANRSDEPLDEEEVLQFMKDRKDKYFPTMAYHLWKIEARPRKKPDSMPPGMAELLGSQMLNVLVQKLPEAERLLDERARIAGKAVYLAPLAVLERVFGEDDTYKAKFSDAGQFDSITLKQELALNPSDLTPGKFTRPRMMPDGTAVSWYLTQQEKIDPPAPETVMGRGKWEYRIYLQRKPYLDQIEQMEKDGRLKFNFPTTGVGIP